jgi:hypothetical protein
MRRLLMKINADNEAAKAIEDLIDFALKAGGKAALQYIAGLINAGVEIIEDAVEDLLDGDEEE